MKFGLFGVCSGICADPAVGRRLARLAEDLGYESLWTGEHVVLPEPRQAPSPAEPEFPMLHPSTGLAFLAAVTEHVLLGTGIVLIAQRNPVVLAKEMASLDVLSGGRLVLGVGAGYLHQEFRALGIPFDERGARTDEAIDVLRALWNEPHPRFRGQFTSFNNIQSQPRPVQPGGPPIVVGGTSRAALRRAVQKAQGWYGFALDVEQTRTVLERLHALERDIGRPDALGALEISVSPRAALDEATVDAYRELGVHRLIPLLPQDDETRLLRYVENLARRFLER
ncbi:MAG: LLM class F420-dependent oxidoreductase [Pseudomonadales bacterium]|nr:LLM class F420-dependent oxidoreductase [Pseudomonadales bacterium]